MHMHWDCSRPVPIPTVARGNQYWPFLSYQPFCSGKRIHEGGLSYLPRPTYQCFLLRNVLDQDLFFHSPRAYLALTEYISTEMVSGGEGGQIENQRKTNYSLELKCICVCHKRGALWMTFACLIWYTPVQCLRLGRICFLTWCFITLLRSKRLISLPQKLIRWALLCYDLKPFMPRLELVFIKLMQAGRWGLARRRRNCLGSVTLLCQFLHTPLAEEPPLFPALQDGPFTISLSANYLWSW